MGGRLLSLISRQEAQALGADFVVKDDQLQVLNADRLWSQPGRHFWTSHHLAAGLAAGPSAGLSCCSPAVVLRKASWPTARGLLEWAVQERGVVSRTPGEAASDLEARLQAQEDPVSPRETTSRDSPQTGLWWMFRGCLSSPGSQGRRRPRTGSIPGC